MKQKINYLIVLITLIGAFTYVGIGIARINNPEPLVKRWVQPYFESIAVTDATFSSTTVSLLEFELVRPSIIDGVSYVKGTTVNTADVVLTGIYGPITTEETCSGAPLLVQATTTVSAGSSQDQFVDMTNTYAPMGRYYVGVATNGTSTQYRRQSNGTQVVGWGQTMTKTGSDVSLPSTCSSPTNTGSNMPGLRVRLVP